MLQSRSQATIPAVLRAGQTACLYLWGHFETAVFLAFTFGAMSWSDTDPLITRSRSPFPAEADMVKLENIAKYLKEATAHLQGHSVEAQKDCQVNELSRYQRRCHSVDTESDARRNSNNEHDNASEQIRKNSRTGIRSGPKDQGRAAASPLASDQTTWRRLHCPKIARLRTRGATPAQREKSGKAACFRKKRRADRVK
jgi:hypothetical protein